MSVLLPWSVKTTALFLCKRSIAVFVSIVLPLSTVQNTFNLQKTTKNVNKSFYNELLKIKKVVYFK